ncbi:hypothetical protein FPV67DRAFT_1522950 [Lyophyllum atratum]|nr:hypothetical protein FPV67DRAFT_1522950 [Lyophyllum atratum]
MYNMRYGDVTAPCMASLSNLTLHVGASVPETRQQTEFLDSQMKRFNMSMEEFRAACKSTYGSLQRAMEVIQECDAKDAAATAKAFPPGEPPKVIGRKPIPGDDRDVQVAALGDGVWVRTWGGDVADQGCCCFDFINELGQHMRTPSSVKIFAEATAWMPRAEVLSIEASFEEAEQESAEFAMTLHNSINESGAEPDPEWETYVVQHGVRLCFKQAGKEDVFLDIPGRITDRATLTLRPWP